MSDQLAEALNAVVSAASGRLLAIDPVEAGQKPSADRWSRKEILGHLIDSAANNHQRFVRALEASELHFPGYAQGAWVAAQSYGDREWHALVDLWTSYNLHIVHVVAHIPPSKLSTSCAIGADAPVTLGTLIQDYVSHLEHHLKQIEHARSD